MEFKSTLTSKERRTLLRGGALSAAFATTATLSLVDTVSAQTNCGPLGARLLDQYSGRYEASRLADPTQPLGARVSLSDVVVGDGKNPIQLDIKNPNVVVLSDGRRGVKDVQIYDYDSPQGGKYVRKDPNTPFSIEIPCGTYVGLRINQIDALPSVTAVTTRGIATSVPVAPPQTFIPTATARVETPTATPTTKVETPTPTATTKVETPTATITPIVHTPTPTPTERVVVITSTPTETPYATVTPALPPTFERDLGRQEALWCLAPIATVAAVVAGVALMTRNDQRSRVHYGYAAGVDEALIRRQESLLENLRHELSEGTPAATALRTWLRDEKNGMYSVDITSATAPAILKHTVGQALELLTIRKNGLNAAHRSMLDAFRDHRERLAGVDPVAKEVVDTKDASETARNEAIHDHSKRAEAFDKTKIAVQKKRGFAATQPEHPLNSFDEETQVASNITGRRRPFTVPYFGWQPHLGRFNREEYY